MMQVTCLVLTNQSALFQSEVIALLKYSFMKWPPRQVQISNEHFLLQNFAGLGFKLDAFHDDHSTVKRRAIECSK